MSWYETTSDRSITLCRALIADNPALLGKFDDVLRSHGFENLTIGAMKPLFTSQEEAVRELRWLREFLTNVVKRTNGLKQEPAIDVEDEPKLDESEIDEPQVDESEDGGTQEDEPEKGKLQVNNSQAEESQIEELQTEEPQADESQADESQADVLQTEASQINEPQVDESRANKKGDDEQKPIEKPNAHTEVSTDRKPSNKSQLLKKGRMKLAQRLELRQDRRQAIQKRRLANVRPNERRKSRSNTSKSAEEEEADEDDEKWCICRKPSAGLMLACDNAKCPTEWFHAKCVGLKSVPKKWFCPKCRRRM